MNEIEPFRQEDLLTFLKPPWNLTKPDNNEVRELKRIKREMEQLYEEFISVDDSRPIWEVVRAQEPRDIEIHVTWEESSQSPRTTSNIVVLTGAQSPNLWLPHNWYFFQYHFLHGGADREGGKVFFIKNNKIGLYKNRVLLGLIDGPGVILRRSPFARGIPTPAVQLTPEQRKEADKLIQVGAQERSRTAI